MQRTITPFKITIILGDSSPVAQIEHMERITDDDGSVISSRSLPAEPLPLPLSESILGAVNAAALSRIGELEAKIVSLQSAPQEPPPTDSIKAWQAKAVLSLMGLLSAAESVIDSLEEPQRTIVKSAWANNADFPRQSPTILSLATALSLTEEQVDQMFDQAAALSV